MAASRKPSSADAAVVRPAEKFLAGTADLRGRSLAVGLSGGVDSVVLLHVMHRLAPGFGYRISAFHVNHGLSPNAGQWEAFCRSLCIDLGIPFRKVRVKVVKKHLGLEAAARDARRAEFSKLRVDAVVLAHQLDDQAETVLLNLLRGAGVEGASGMAAVGKLGGKLVFRPLLGISRKEILAYARRRRLRWIEDESNSNEALTRNYIRRRVGPLLAKKFPRWRESLARAARHFAAAGLDANRLLRAYLSAHGLRAPSEAKLLEMLKQFGARSAAIEHDGAVLRLYQGKIFSSKQGTDSPSFEPQTWNGETRIALPALGGELRFKRVRGQGIDCSLIKAGKFQIRLRSGGERLRPDARRPRRTLKNLFQEAGVPPWERERLPLLYCRNKLVWVPGFGVDASFQAAGSSPGIVVEWQRRD